MDIIQTAAAIGTEEFAANIPEYCGVISVKPTTSARLHRIKAEEARMDEEVLKRAFERRRHHKIDKIDLSEETAPDIEMLPTPLVDHSVIDIRHPVEQEAAPLELASGNVEHIPFYKLHKRAEEMDKNAGYMLYCDQGVMSRLHAAHMKEQGFTQVCVYRPNATSTGRSTQ